MAIVAVGQLCSSASMSRNLAQCKTIIDKAVSIGAKVLFLPEAADYISSTPEESLSLVKDVQESVFVLGICREARAAKLPISVGIHEPSEDRERVKNTLIWIDRDGEIVQRYQKLHLFDVEIDGGPKIKESKVVERGRNTLPPFETAIGKVGLTICFDLRFPEISLSLRRQGCQILAYPSAFIIATGKAHWEILLRARAIETQSYVIAAAQAGQHNEKRLSYGHSVIISPWGEVIASLDGRPEPSMITAEIDLSALERIRREMPLLRRTDIYPEL